MPGGGVAVLDNRFNALYAIDRTGTARQLAPRPDQAIDLTADDQGSVYVSTPAELIRYQSADPTKTLWRTNCRCDRGGRLAASASAVYYTQSSDNRVQVLDAQNGIGRGALERANQQWLWPTDVVIDADGRLLTADVVSGIVEGWTNLAAPDVNWFAGQTTGPERLAAGSLADGTHVFAALTADDLVEVQATASGVLLARFQPALPDGTPIAAEDLAMGAGGRIYLASPDSGALFIFEPAPPDAPDGTAQPGTPPPGDGTPTVPGGPGATPSATPTAFPTPSDKSCRVTGNKEVWPTSIRLGETAQITLTFGAECPSKPPTTGADILLVMDRSGSMEGRKLVDAKNAAKSFVEVLDLSLHRVGLVSFSDDARLDQGLTTDGNRVITRIRSLAANGGTNITDALRLSDRTLMGNNRPGALRVIVLLTDGQDFSGPLVLRATAAKVRDHGIQIYAIGLGLDADGDTLREVAGREDRYFQAPTPADLYTIYGEISQRVNLSISNNLVIDDEMAPGILLVAGSGAPTALEAPNRLRWGRAQLPASAVMTYRIKPTRAGLLPTNQLAVADYTDADGLHRQFVFPVPVIEVIPPTPTPSATPTQTDTPTDTPTATTSPTPRNSPTPTATATPLPSPTPHIRTIYLPIALHEVRCTPETARVNVAVVLDASSSMGERTQTGGTKLEAAVAAARAFLDQLRLNRGDQATIITFNSQATKLQRLTSDRALLDRAFGQIKMASQTRLDLGIRAATTELVSGGRHPLNSPVIVVVTDGRANPVPVSEAIKEANRAKRYGMTIFTIGLGSDLDFDALAAIASRPEDFYRAPSASDLARIYSAIARVAPCPVSRYLGRR